MYKKVILTITLFIFSLIGSAQENKTSVSNDCKWEIPDVLSKESSQEGGFQFITHCNCDVQDFELSIFDRWGHAIFTTKDITEPWDASEADDAVYFVTIKGMYSDGNEYDYTGKFHLMKE